MTPQAYPLHWPSGQRRKESRERSRFDTSFAVARDSLAWELERLGARYPVLSTNIELRLDGKPYANRAEPEDPGVAVYFEWQGRQMCFACDKWDRVRDNIQAIRKTIEAIRGIERWGSSDMMQRAFSAFEELPAPGQNENWRDVLGCPGANDLGAVKAQYRKLTLAHHPDRGGDKEQFIRIKQAWDQARRELAA